MAGNKTTCFFKNISYIDIRNAMIQGARTVDEIKEMTGVCTGCVICKALVQNVIDIKR